MYSFPSFYYVRTERVICNAHRFSITQTFLTCFQLNYLLKSGFRALYRNFVIRGIAIQNSQIKILYIQIQIWKYKLQSQNKEPEFPNKSTQYSSKNPFFRRRKKQGIHSKMKIHTFSFIIVHMILVISSPKRTKR